ncbi:MAG: efflux RND transporter periplasmic adaptor subunit [Magnetococcales bacterium]|nr:efflux RND transporter periplasmic adaptor subunit [Magnetococcales bacterium]
MRIKLFSTIILLATITVLEPSTLAVAANSSTRQARVVLEVEDESLLSSQLDGRIKQINVRDGDRFKAGDELISIDCAIYQARRKKIQAEHAAAKYNLEAQKKLKQLRTGSNMQLHTAMSNLAKAEADLDIIQVTLEMCSIKAPFSGLVVKRMAHIQQFITKGEPLLEIIDDSTIEAHLIVPSNWLLWLKEGDEFTFNLDETNNHYRASVTNIGSRIDSGSQTVTIKGAIKGSNPELRAGMGGYATFTAPPQQKR